MTCEAHVMGKGQVEQRIEPAKKAAQVIFKKLQGCLQSQQGLDAERRMKKLPLMSLSVSMAESFKDFDGESSIRRVLEMCCFMEQTLATILADFEMKLEREVLEPLNKLSEEDLPEILKNKKQFAKLTTDWNNARTKSQASTGAQAKQDGLREEMEEAWRRLESIKDEYSADLYHFATKEDDYANYFIRLLELQADYHKGSHEFLDKHITELKETRNPKEPPRNISKKKVYGEPLLSHLQESGRDIAVPIQECVHMLLHSAMKEEGLFRLAAAASVVKRLKSSLDGGVVDHSEFDTDQHAVAGALKCYLRELPEPLMTFELYTEWFQAAGEKELPDKLDALRAALKKLPPENYNNLRYLVQFLSRLSEHQAVNRMTPSNIAIVLGPNLLWPRVEGELAMLDMASASSVQVVAVIEPLIQYCSDLFPEAVDFDVPQLPDSPVETPTLPPSLESGKEKLTRSASSTSTASSCSSSYHSALSKTNSSASQDGGGYFLVKSGSVSRGTITWGTPSTEPLDPTQCTSTALNPAQVPSPTLLAHPSPISSPTWVQSPGPAAAPAPNPNQAASAGQKQSSETVPLETIIEAPPDSPIASLKISSPFKPRRSFVQHKMPSQASKEQVVVQFSKSRAPVPPKPQAPGPPKPQAPAPPVPRPKAPENQPQPEPRSHPPALKKPAVKKPGVPPPLPPLLETK
ncbi:bargin [Aplochiton taeniatus]